MFMHPGPFLSLLLFFSPPLSLTTVLDRRNGKQAADRTRRVTENSLVVRASAISRRSVPPLPPLLLFTIPPPLAPFLFSLKFSYEMLLTILKLPSSPRRFKAPVCRLMRCLYIDRDPQIEIKYPRLIRTSLSLGD
jgi:hypothetical protein